MKLPVDFADLRRISSPFAKANTKDRNPADLADLLRRQLCTLCFYGVPPWRMMIEKMSWGKSVIPSIFLVHTPCQSTFYCTFKTTTNAKCMKTSLLLLTAVLAFTRPVLSQTDEDKKLVLQQCLDLPQLQDYFRSTQPGRLPVVVENNGKVPAARLSKFGQDVKFMTEDELTAAGKDAFIEFIRFEIAADNATVIYRYSIENLMVTVLLRKARGTWTVTDSKLVER